MIQISKGKRKTKLKKKIRENRENEEVETH